MILGTLKLDTDNNYVYKDGSLPEGPVWDKQWLASLVKCNTISKDAVSILPPSMQEHADYGRFATPSLTVKISEMNDADILIVTRVTNNGAQGKKFRFDNFIPLTTTAGQIELWRKI